jgi:hypothetical protein
MDAARMISGLLAAILVASSSEACTLTDQTPIGTANQGGYSFNYQSGKGKECRQYQVRNTPGRVLTPVLWKSSIDTFLDINIPACRTGEVCRWLTAVHPSRTPVDVGVTELSFGVNRDEYKQEPDGYRKKRETQQAAPKREAFGPLTSRIAGTVAGLGGTPTEIGIEVMSRVMGDGPFVVAYVISVLRRSTPVRLLQAGVPKLADWEIGVDWQAAMSKAFIEALMRKDVMLLSARLTTIEVSIPAKEIYVEESKQLVVLQGRAKIAAMTTPVYRPRE